MTCGNICSEVLVDAQALIWAAGNPDLLSTDAAKAMQDPDNHLVVSCGTAWEICIKAGLGKLELDRPLLEWLNTTMDSLEAELLPISLAHAVRQAELPFHHRDPFDRLIVAQALCEGYAVISSDGMLDSYGVRRVW